jgi:beta-lactamase regulating signal transducer with metallopeptidase domain/DNA-binding beta-propeller fold protein YncE
MNDVGLQALLNAQPFMLFLKGSVVLLIGFGAVLLLRRAAAEKHRFIWNLTFVALLVVALGIWAFPKFEIGLFAVTPQEEQSVMPAANIAVEKQQIHSRLSVETAMKEEDAPSLRSPSDAPPTIERTRTPMLSTTWLAGTWVAGSAVMLLFFLYQLVLTAVYRRQAEPITDMEWIKEFGSVKDKLGVTAPVRLLRHRQVTMPMTWGIFRPVIILPADAVRWSEERRRIVLLHEMAHIRRYDYLSILTSQIACIVYWCNPFVWLARRRALIAREKSCDDYVLRSGVSITSYTRELLVTAQSLKSCRVTGVPVLAMGRPNELRARVIALLDAGQRRGTYPARTAFITTIFGLASTLIISCAQPRVAAQEVDDTRRETFVYASSAEYPELQSVTSVTVSPDGRFVYTAAFSFGTIGIFQRDVETGILKDPTFMTDDTNLEGAVALRLTKDGRRAVVTAFRSEAVSLFARDPSSGALSILDRAYNGQNGVSSMNWPIDAVFSPDGHFLYVISGYEPGSLVIFSVSEKGELSWVEESTGRDGSFDNARGIAISPNGETIYIASAGASTLTVLDRDGDSGRVSIRQILRDGQEANGLAGAFSVVCSADGRHVYVSSGRFGGDNAVSVFKRQTDGSLKLVQELIGERSGLDPFSGGNEIMLSPDGRHVFAAGNGSGTVAHLSRDPETGMLVPLQILYQGTDGAAGLGMDLSGESLYVAAEGESSVAVYRRIWMSMESTSAPRLTERRQAMQ